jgi:CheY-like chemotaxis protein
MVDEVAPALVLVDIQMPKLTGLEVLRKLRTDPTTAEIPVVVISNSTDPAAMEEAHRLTIVDWLVKSQVTPARLASVVRTCLAR